MEFSLHVFWLLSAFCRDTNSSSKRKSLGLKLKEKILSEELRPKTIHLPIPAVGSLSGPVLSPTRKTHHRSFSDATGMHAGAGLGVSNVSNRWSTTSIQTQNPKQSLGDLSTGHAFDSGCICFDSCEAVFKDLRGHAIVCTCVSPRLSPELEFVKALITIGVRLQTAPTKDLKSNASLKMLDF